MPVKIICDIGSCHGNRPDYFRRAISVARDLGVSLKCQLFGPELAIGGNVMLCDTVYAMACELAACAGVDMFASVWSRSNYATALCVARHTGCKSIKFAYSQRENPQIKDALDDFDTVYVSGQHLDLPKFPAGVTPLLCIPQYPVYTWLSFDGCFPPFKGFSDHTLGYDQSCYACADGANVLEKHVKFNSYTGCPDATFAIDETQLACLVKDVRDI
jgi:hypothetical protein